MLERKKLKSRNPKITESRSFLVRYRRTYILNNNLLSLSLSTVAAFYPPFLHTITSLRFFFFLCMLSRHNRYWQTAYPKFLVAPNCLKKGSRNILFFVYFKKLSRFWGKFSSTALVIDTYYVKYWSVLTHY